VQVAGRRLAVVEGKGGHHRVVPAAGRFFAALGDYLHDERPAAAATEKTEVIRTVAGSTRSRHFLWTSLGALGVG
jgi:site-specific recombinase XerD